MHRCVLLRAGSSIVRWLVGLGLVALSFPRAASAEDVRVMISGGFFQAYIELGPAFERATGHRLVTTRGPSMGDSPEAIPARLARGETADVLILDGDAARELARRGLVRHDTLVDLARSQIGMVVRAGAAKPDIGSVEAFRRMLLAVKSVGYSDSASGTYFAYPSQTLYLGRDAGRDGDRAREAESQVAGWRERGEMYLPKFPEQAIAEVDDSIEYPVPGSPDHAPKAAGEPPAGGGE